MTTAERAGLPSELAPHRVRRRVLVVVGLLGLLAVVVWRAPGLGEVRERLGDANPWWLAVALVFEFASGVSYVAMFRPVFCPRMSWRTSWEIGWAELGMGSLVPASGAGGLALGAWILHRRGMPTDRIARRSVAFFLIKSSVNFVAVAVIGGALAIGLFDSDLGVARTAVPAVLSLLVIGAVIVLARRGGEWRAPPPSAGRVRRAVVAAEQAVVGGAREAVRIVRSGNLLVIGGAIGYWAFDNAVLWATFKAVGADPGLDVILLGYLIGQLGGLLPIPGGVGGIDGGLIGVLVLYGAPAGAAAAAVFAYRLILFWLPLVIGTAAFVSLRRALEERDREELHAPVTSVVRAT